MGLHVADLAGIELDPSSMAVGIGLLGLGGLDPFLLTLDSYEEWSELRPRE